MLEIKNLLKRILNLQTLGFFVALCSLLVAIQQNWLSKGGDILIKINNEEVSSDYTISSYIYYNDTQIIDKTFSILPIIENNSRYTVNDLSVKYNISTFNISITTSPNYLVNQTDEYNVQLKNTNSSLYAFETLDSPIGSFILKNASSPYHCRVDLKVTYNGIDKPISIHQNIYFKYVSDKHNFQDLAFTDFANSYNSRYNYALYLYQNGSLSSYNIKEVLAAYDKQQQDKSIDSSTAKQNAKSPKEKEINTSAKQEKKSNIVEPQPTAFDNSAKATKTSPAKSDKKEGGWLTIVIGVLICIIALGVIFILMITIFGPTSEVIEYTFGKSLLEFKQPTWQGIKDAYNNGVLECKKEIKDIFKTYPGDWIDNLLLIVNIPIIIIVIIFIILTFLALALGLIALIINLFK